ncbi:MAG: TIGR02281 family clan AA aspartic protease [Beijerinckiaceae bacterium]|nr:TIGR02281 family clan AA aspartic protease [Beijerinckiaceae bacterium]
MRSLLLIGAIAIAGTVIGNSLAGKITEPAPAAKPAQVASMQSSTAAPRVVALRADARGHFATDILVQNQFVKALVDTGASVVAFSHEDAKKAGIVPASSAYTVRMQTANGIVMAALVRIPELRLQGITVRDVEATVMPPGALPFTLLGMSFLRRLSSFEMNGNTLLLKQ